MSEKYKKRIICNLPDYEYGEFISSLKYENIPYPVRIIRFLIVFYLAGDKDARAIVENYKQKNNNIFKKINIPNYLITIR